MACAQLTPERLRELLNYDPETGVFTWRVNRNVKTKAGDVAGCAWGNLKCPSRISIGVDYRKYLAHRLAWLYVTGEWPTDVIDHRDVDATNNVFKNLRDVTDSANKQNVRVPRSHNKLKVLGVTKNGKNGYMAMLTLNGVRYYLGTYRTTVEAHAEYVAAKRKLHEFGTL